MGGYNINNLRYAEEPAVTAVNAAEMQQMFDIAVIVAGGGGRDDKYQVENQWLYQIKVLFDLV